MGNTAWIALIAIYVIGTLSTFSLYYDSHQKYIANRARALALRSNANVINVKIAELEVLVETLLADGKYTEAVEVMREVETLTHKVCLIYRQGASEFIELY